MSWLKSLQILFIISFVLASVSEPRSPAESGTVRILLNVHVSKTVSWLHQFSCLPVYDAAVCTCCITVLKCLQSLLVFGCSSVHKPELFSETLNHIRSHPVSDYHGRSFQPALAAERLSAPGIQRDLTAEHLKYKSWLFARLKMMQLQCFGPPWLCEYHFFLYLEEICTLVIAEVFPEDSGMFTCTASNKYGTVSSSAELKVKGNTSVTLYEKHVTTVVIHSHKSALTFLYIDSDFLQAMAGIATMWGLSAV